MDADTKDNTKTHTLTLNVTEEQEKELKASYIQASNGIGIVLVQKSTKM